MLNDAKACWDAALLAADPSRAVGKAIGRISGKLRVEREGKLVIASIGKASIPMAQAFLEFIGGLIKTGPTGTNVMDIIFLIKRRTNTS